MNTDQPTNGYRAQIADIGERLYRTALSHPSVAREYADELSKFIHNSAVTRLHQVRRNLEGEMIMLDSSSPNNPICHQLASLHSNVIYILAQLQEVPKGYQHLLDTSLETYTDEDVL